jgi:serine/threonine-protein kinase
MLVGQKLGDFEIEREIGQGAMGTVYSARYVKDGTLVAIKIISGGYNNANAIARFERETAILKKLSHPNIVRLYATGKLRGAPFYVMEYVDGETLEAILQRRGRFTWEEVIPLGQQLCSALQHAHHLGIVHRDLKPGNIMMLPDGAAKLMDFGIAKGLELSQLTATNCTVGTAAYMSPEQCRGERDLTSKSDLYSLGVLFYELLTGRRPFLAENTLDMFLAHTEGRFERPSRLVLDIPVWLDTLVCQMLEKKPQHRPYDAAMVARALQEVQEKVSSQRSAGVDAITGTGSAVKKRKKAATEADKAAARTLRTAVLKTQVKKKTPSLGERGWFQITAILTVILVVGGIIYVGARPPSAQALFDKAQALMKSTDPDDWSQAREGPIADYLRRFGEASDEQGKQIQRWADQIDLEEKERQLRNRMRMKMTPEGAAERLAQSAVHSEQAGELDLAAESWAKVKEAEEAKAPDGRAWQLLADRRLETLQEVARREEVLKARLDQSHRGDNLPGLTDRTEQQAFHAVRAELFGDLLMAYSSWKKMSEASEANPIWRLLGLKKVSELRSKRPRGTDEVQYRQALVEQKLNDATNMRKGTPSEAKKIYQDIAVLYEKANDPHLAGQADAAKKALEEMGLPPRR